MLNRESVKTWICYSNCTIVIPSSLLTETCKVSPLCNHSNFLNMRKIEEQMNAAIVNRTNWKSGNTRVVCDTDLDKTCHVYLHNNLIAKITYYSVQLFDGGWQSVTTKSRLNALLDQVGKMGEGVFQKNYSWFFRFSNGDVIDFESGMLLT